MLIEESAALACVTFRRENIHQMFLYGLVFPPSTSVLSVSCKSSVEAELCGYYPSACQSPRLCQRQEREKTSRHNRKRCSLHHFEKSVSGHPLTVFSLCSDPRLQGLRREYQQARAAPGYDELDAARRRVLDYDPNRVSV